MNGDTGLLRVESTHLHPAPDLDAQLRRALTEDPLHLDLRNYHIPSWATAAQAGILLVDGVCWDLNPTEVPDGRRPPPLPLLPLHRLQRGEQAALLEGLGGGGVDRPRLYRGV